LLVPPSITITLTDLQRCALTDRAINDILSSCSPGKEKPDGPAASSGAWPPVQRTPAWTLCGHAWPENRSRACLLNSGSSFFAAVLPDRGERDWLAIDAVPSGARDERLSRH